MTSTGNDGTAALDKALDVLEAVGWSVARPETDGSMDRVVALPVPAPTRVVFGGEHGRTLFATTACDALDRESLDAAPLSGRLFVASGG